MKYFYCSVIALAILLGGHSWLSAEVLETVKVHPREGEPAVFRDFFISWDHKIQARWNKQLIEIRVADIKSIKVLNIHPANTHAYEVEVTFLKGNRAIIQIKDFCRPCEGDSPEGFKKISSDDIMRLDLHPK